MKKLVGSIAIFAALCSFSPVNAQETSPVAVTPAPATAEVKTAAPAAANPLFDELIKIAEKCTTNSQYSMEIKAKVNGKELTSKMKFYFKDMNSYRFDTETADQKTRAVVTPESSWLLIENKNILMKISNKEMLEKMNLKVMLEKQKATSDVTKTNEGGNDVYTTVDRELKTKSVLTIDSKQGVYAKAMMYNEKGELISEASFSGWDFKPLADDIFKKPEGVKETEMPQMPAKPAEGEHKK